MSFKIYVEPHGLKPMAPSVMATPRRNSSPPSFRSAELRRDTRIPPRAEAHGLLRRRVNRQLGITAIVLALSISVKAENGDWQLWSGASWNQNIGNALDVGLRTEFRNEQDMDRFAYYEIEPSLTFRYSPRWDFILAYERDERFEPQEEVMHVPNVASLLKLPLKKFLFTNRARMDFVIPESSNKDLEVVYRDLFNLSYSWKWGSKELSPYLFNEFFLSTTEGSFTENRAGIGLRIPLISHWAGQIYFMRQDIRTGEDWVWHPVLGVQIQTQF